MAYAKTTTVPVSQSQAEIKDMLRGMGADRLAVYEMPEGNYVIFQVPPRGEGLGCTFKLSQPRPEKKGATDKQLAQMERSAWRALVLLVKAKKVAIDGGITTLEREFMADTVMPDGSTLIEHHAAIISHNYTDGPPQIGYAP